MIFLFFFQISGTFNLLLRSKFANDDEYVKYLKRHLKVGMKVRCWKTFDNWVLQGDEGTVTTNIVKFGGNVDGIKAFFMRSLKEYFVSCQCIEIYQ